MIFQTEKREVPQGEKIQYTKIHHIILNILNCIYYNNSNYCDNLVIFILTLAGQAMGQLSSYSQAVKNSTLTLSYSVTCS